MNSSVLLLASMFDQHGGWTDDRQFFDLIGSTCLLAHGLGVPVADASTTFTANDWLPVHVASHCNNLPGVEDDNAISIACP